MALQQENFVYLSLTEMFNNCEHARLQPRTANVLDYAEETLHIAFDILSKIIPC